MTLSYTAMEKPCIYVNGFWNGFLEKTDANHIDFFEQLFHQTSLRDLEWTCSDLARANILFESHFGNSLTSAKSWTCTIHYSGEPYDKPHYRYDVVLTSKSTESNVVDVPLFVYYIHGNAFLPALMHRPRITVVPPHFCCFIVTNGNCAVRNKMFARLNQYKKVHSYGKFANNMGQRLTVDYWTDAFRRFLATYKFIICFENTKIGTYSTEKIINPYLAGTIPIYWSSHHIKQVLNPDSMLFLEDESDESFDRLIQRVIEIDNDDALYVDMVNRPVFRDMTYWNTHYTVEAIAEKIQRILP